MSEQPPAKKSTWWHPVLALVLATSALWAGLEAFHYFSTRCLSFEPMTAAMQSQQSFFLQHAVTRSQGGPAFRYRQWHAPDGRYRAEFLDRRDGKWRLTKTDVCDGDTLWSVRDSGRLVVKRAAEAPQARRRRAWGPTWLNEPLPDEVSAKTSRRRDDQGRRLQTIELTGRLRSGARSATVCLLERTELPLFIEEHMGPTGPNERTARWEYDFGPDLPDTLFKPQLLPTARVIELDHELDNMSQPLATVHADDLTIAIHGLYLNPGGDLFLATFQWTGERPLANGRSDPRTQVERVKTDVGLTFAPCGNTITKGKYTWELLAPLQDFPGSRGLPGEATVQFRRPQAHAAGVPVTHLVGNVPPVAEAEELYSDSAMADGQLERRARALMRREYWDLAIPVLEQALSQAADPRQIKGLTENLARCYERLGRKDRAEALRQKADQGSITVDGPGGENATKRY